MFLSESYKSRMQSLAGIIVEAKKNIEYEFQIRDIGGPVFYKRKKGKSVWEFISSEDFAENCKDGKIIKWNKK
jgi:hypothetical protein